MYTLSWPRLEVAAATQEAVTHNLTSAVLHQVSMGTTTRIVQDFDLFFPVASCEMKHASGGRGDPHPVLGAAGARPRRLRGRRQGEQSLPHSGERGADQT